jgi:hypothetical protein
MVGSGGILTFLPILLLVKLIGDFPGYLHAMTGGAGQYAGIGTWSSANVLLQVLLHGPIPAPLFLFFGIALVSPYRWLAFSSLLISVLVIFSPRREYEHYLLSFFPAIALMIAIGVDQLMQRQKNLGWAGLGLVLLLVLPTSIKMLWVTSKDTATWEWEQIAAKIDRVTPPDARLMVVGRITAAEAIMYMSQRSPSSEYWITWELDPPVSSLLPQPIEQIKADYLDFPPDVIAIEDDYFHIDSSGFQLIEPAGTHQHFAVLIAATLLQRPGEYVLQSPGQDKRYFIFTRTGTH